MGAWARGYKDCSRENHISGAEYKPNISRLRSLAKHLESFSFMAFGLLAKAK